MNGKLKIKKTLTIVVPVYFNESNLPDTIPTLLALSNQLPEYNLDLIFVDDGSGDRSINILLDYQKQFPETIKVLKLTRNFGSMAAIQAGLTVATGDCVAMVAADLQDPPELLIDMIKHWEKGVKAIFAIRSNREESFIQKFFSYSYYTLIRWFAIPNYPVGGFDLFLIDRQVVEEVNKIQEKNTSILTLIFWLGFDAVMIPYVRRKRKKGNSRWTLSKKIKLFVDTFVSFSYFPIRLFSTIGILYAIASFLYGAFVFVYWAFYGATVEGWVTMMLVLTFTAGLQMTLLGILGEYLWRTLDTSRKRPLFVIDTYYKDNDHIDVEK
ncbi:MAG: glycosyltransferase family 2 protein [Anaerolineae bacterium]|nr:glycosyltransferase family 2 protein [Anaerolineae bacterium]MDK1080289.1 glycosyltransferase family 2 protein [Anaerolineae bacterium]